MVELNRRLKPTDLFGRRHARMKGYNRIYFQRSRPKQHRHPAAETEPNDADSAGPDERLRFEKVGPRLNVLENVVIRVVLESLIEFLAGLRALRQRVKYVRSESDKSCHGQCGA